MDNPLPWLELSALSALSDDQREILRLRVVEGLSAEQAADLLGCTPQAVRLSQHHALEVVRNELAARTDNDQLPLDDGSGRRVTPSWALIVVASGSSPVAARAEVRSSSLLRVSPFLRDQTPMLLVLRHENTVLRRQLAGRPGPLRARRPILVRRPVLPDTSFALARDLPGQATRGTLLGRHRRFIAWKWDDPAPLGGASGVREDEPVGTRLSPRGVFVADLLSTASGKVRRAAVRALG